MPSATLAAAPCSRSRLGIPYNYKPGRTLDVYLAHSRPAPSPKPRSSPPLTRVSSVTTLPDVDVGSQVDGDVEFPAGTWGDQAPGSPMNGGAGLSPVVVLVYDVGTMGPIRPRKWMFSLLGVKMAQQGYGALVCGSRGADHSLRDSGHHDVPQWRRGGHDR